MRKGKEYYQDIDREAVDDAFKFIMSHNPGAHLFPYKLGGAEIDYLRLKLHYKNHAALNKRLSFESKPDGTLIRLRRR